MMNRYFVLFFLCFVGLQLASFQRLYAQGEMRGRFALVIGNSNYREAPLLTPKADCELIRGALEQVGFEVSLHFDVAKRSDLIGVLNDFETKTSNAEIVLIYYAGHGIAVGGENYVLPTNQEFRTQRDVEDYAVSTKKILRAFESNENRANILILDACRNNPFANNWARSRGAGGAGLTKEAAPFGSIVSYSTSYGSTAADGNARNSPFAESLAKNLVFPNISIERVFAKTREEVMRKTNRMQRPVEENQLVGDEIILKEVRTLSDLTMDNYRNALDTTCCSMKAQVYATMLEVYKEDSAKTTEISREWFYREFGPGSEYAELIDFLSADICWNWQVPSDTLQAVFPQELFEPIVNVLDNLDRSKWGLDYGDWGQKLILHELAFIQVIDMLALDADQPPIRDLHHITM